MATINYATEENLAAGYVKVEWAGLSPGDEGQPFDSRGLELVSIHYWGDFNSNAGLVLLYASNELAPAPANFGEFIYSNAPRFQMLPDGRASVRMVAIMPKANADMITGNVSLLFAKRD